MLSRKDNRFSGTRDVRYGVSKFNFGKENGMAWASRYKIGVTLSACLLLSSFPVLAQNTLGGNAPLNTPSISDDRQSTTAKGSEAEQAARDLASRYLDLWSAPKQVTLASASSFYAPVVMFHGQRRTLASVVAEKRRFAQRWPNRTYSHRPETTQVQCEDDGLRCTVKSSFDFAASSTQLERRSLGIGEHELVVSFIRGRPMIVSEDSRVIIRGRGNMTQFLRQRF
jgi:hypothetical protein